MRRFPESERKKFKAFKKLNSPQKIQDFVDAIRINFELNGDTCRSPLMVLTHGKAHCVEGAMLAASILWYHGAKPLLMDLRSTADDEDHVVAIFKERSGWGAISKTSHAVLRYRDPVYRSVRELAMSYFNEYFLENGKKTLRSYSVPFNLLRYGTSWLTSKENLWHIPEELDECKHFTIADARTIRSLRLADPIERKAGKLMEQKKKPQRTGHDNYAATTRSFPKRLA